MTYETNQRLCSYLNGNQPARERMCRATLATDRRFADVRPRHPDGGPGGGRDLEASLRSGERVIGAVGFVNTANDSRAQKRRIKAKFEEDVAAAPAERADVMFVFMTNVALTVGERDALVRHARSQGFSDCDVFDRERLRIALDQPSGFFIRFQYLGVALSEAEQASFLAQYGEDIQAVVATGFARVDEALARLTFLTEARDVLTGLHLQLELDRTYSADEIGHFRAFMLLYLVEVTDGVYAILFGSTDKQSRTRDPDTAPFGPDKSGIRHGISRGQWERKVDVEKLRAADAAAENDDEHDDGEGASADLPGFQSCGWGISVGAEEVKAITISYSKERHGPTFAHERGMTLQDLHEATGLPFVNRSLAEKVARIHIYANGYKVDELGRDDFHIDYNATHLEIDHLFSPEEMADPWVRLRPVPSSAYHFDFYRKTPRRLFKSPPVGTSS